MTLELEATEAGAAICHVASESGSNGGRVVTIIVVIAVALININFDVPYGCNCEPRDVI